MDLHSSFPSIGDLKRHARRKVPHFVWEYLDSGTGSEVTLHKNRAALDDVEFYDANDCDINSNIATIKANATNWRNGPHLTCNQWCALDPSAQKLWDELSNEAKAIILKKPPPAPNLS